MEASHPVTPVTHFLPTKRYIHRTHHPVVTLIWLHPLHKFHRPNATSTILITRSLHSFANIRYTLPTGQMLHPSYSSPGRCTHLATSVTHFPPAKRYIHHTHHPVVALIWLHPLHTFHRPNATSTILITRSLHSFCYIHHTLSTGQTLHPPYSLPGRYTHLLTSVTHFQPATPYVHRTHHPVVTLIWLHPVTHFPLQTFHRPNATAIILITRSLHSFGYIRHTLSTGHTHDTYSISHTLSSLRPSNTPRRFTHFGHVRYARQATLVQLTQSLHTDSPGYIRYTRQATLVQNTLTHLATSVTLARPHWSKTH